MVATLVIIMLIALVGMDILKRKRAASLPEKRRHSVLFLWEYGW